MFTCHTRPCKISSQSHISAFGSPYKSRLSLLPSAISSTPNGRSRQTWNAKPCAAVKDNGSPALEGACLAALPLLLKASAASADDLTAPARGISIGEVVLLAAPIILYGLFNIYRAKVNPKATISDFLFITAGIVIVGNIFSILIFKVRIF